MSDETPSMYDLESRWISAEGIPEVRHNYGDIVRIKSGDNAGETGQINALSTIEPEPKYGVILPPNEKFIWVLQKDLESTGKNSGRTLTLMKAGEKPRTSQPR